MDWVVLVTAAFGWTVTLLVVVVSYRRLIEKVDRLFEKT
jgi:hypothetical protein